MQLEKICSEDFAAIYKEMEKNFILAERRDFAPAYELLQQEQYIMYHLVDNGEKVGFISLWQLTGFTYVEHFVVYEAYRNKGYGKALIKKLASICIERECGRFEWCCLNWNKPSIDFYLSLGAKPLDDWTTYRLDGEALINLIKDK